MNIYDRKVIQAKFHLAVQIPALVKTGLNCTIDKVKMTMTEPGLVIETQAGYCYLAVWSNVLGVTLEPEAKSEASKDTSKVTRKE